jgi:hypothetical protein
MLVPSTRVVVAVAATVAAVVAVAAAAAPKRDVCFVRAMSAATEPRRGGEETKPSPGERGERGRNDAMRAREKCLPAVAQRRTVEGWGKGGEDKGGTLEKLKTVGIAENIPLCNEQRFAWQQSPSASRFFRFAAARFSFPSA